MIEGQALVMVSAIPSISRPDDLCVCGLVERVVETMINAGFDLVLDNASRGKLVFDSAAGKASVNLADLSDSKPRQAFDFGGVDMQLIVKRYPAELSTLSLTQTITPPANKLIPYFVKATQVDGEMVWASPIYFAKSYPFG